MTDPDHAEKVAKARQLLEEWTDNPDLVKAMAEEFGEPVVGSGEVVAMQDLVRRVDAGLAKAVAGELTESDALAAVEAAAEAVALLQACRDALIDTARRLPEPVNWQALGEATDQPPASLEKHYDQVTASPELGAFFEAAEDPTARMGLWFGYHASRSGGQDGGACPTPE
ncbi:hypothetical protein [Longimycelium tulufanense]|uniref:hypothetical protein n=1 Tax=Longimycelium tulufanense TaxID=907463 RepID=UPI001665BC2C|nr:hypothetical protein [Longimycelium tulufanense]